MSASVSKLSDDGLDVIFREARTYNGWKDQDISEQTLKDLYDILKYGPTSANCSPARFKFVKSKEAKEKLKPCLAEGNVEKTMSAPVTVIIGYDMEFYEKLPELFPHTDARSWFVGNDELIKETAFRNGVLQGGYLIMAARALGLDTGPMSGFDADKTTKEFFDGTTIKADWLCNLGYGDESSIFERSPRLSFDEACEII